MIQKATNELEQRRTNVARNSSSPLLRHVHEQTRNGTRGLVCLDPHRGCPNPAAIVIEIGASGRLSAQHWQKRWRRLNADTGAGSTPLGPDT